MRTLMSPLRLMPCALRGVGIRGHRFGLPFVWRAQRGVRWDAAQA